VSKPKLLTERLWFKRVHPTPLIRHLEALRLIRQKGSAGRKRATLIAAVCRRLFTLLNRPYIAKPTERLIAAIEEYAQGVGSDMDLLRAGGDWRDAKLISFTTYINPTDPLYTPTCQSYLTPSDDEHQQKLRTQSLSGELQSRIHLGTQALYILTLDFVGAFNSGRWDDTENLIQGCLFAAIAVGGIDGANELVHQCGIIRDIFGNPFHKPPKFDKRWRTSTVALLAKQMYESRDFSAMPILADALQDAGCDNDTILSHCRDTNQPHVRGCWVVDLVLGKS
jgi:hypothetical protein